jgi:hypothetical protein
MDMPSNQTVDTALALLADHKDDFRIVQVDDMGWWLELCIDEYEPTITILNKLRAANIPVSQISGVVYRVGE